MKVVDQFRVSRRAGTGEAAVIQLVAGDLAAIPAEHAVDALVVSAFPNSYTPDRGTVFASLWKRGLDMRDVAGRKEEDDRTHLGCWLSKPLPPKTVRSFHFKRIICFEPRYPAFIRQTGIDDDIEETVGYVFRCLNNFIIPDTKGRRRFHISSVAMPPLATGNQRVPLDAILPRLLRAAIFWLEEGLPINVLKLVVQSLPKVALARQLFKREKSDYAAQRRARKAAGADRELRVAWEERLASIVRREVISVCKQNLREALMAVAVRDERAVLQRLFTRIDLDVPRGAASVDAAVESDAVAYDVFVSYAHKQEREVKEFIKALDRIVPRPRVFFDRTSIRAGDLWIKKLSDAIRRARLFVAVLSPDYTASLVCWDEFQCAKLKEYTTRQSLIRTIRLYSENDPPPMLGIYHHIDCAEGDVQKLRKSAAAVVRMSRQSASRSRSRSVDA